MTDREMLATEVLKSFIREMDIWCEKMLDGADALGILRNVRKSTNADAGKVYVSEKEFENELRVDLREIFSKYCTVKTRRLGPPEYFSYYFPARYDVNNEKIVSVTEVKKNRIEIETDMFFVHNGLRYRYRYTLIFKNNEWRIDRKSYYQEDEDYWRLMSLI